MAAGRPLVLPAGGAEFPPHRPRAIAPGKPRRCSALRQSMSLWKPSGRVAVRPPFSGVQVRNRFGPLLFSLVPGVIAFIQSPQNLANHERLCAPPMPTLSVIGVQSRRRQSDRSACKLCAGSLVAAVARLHGAHIEMLDNAPGLKFRLRFPGTGARAAAILSAPRARHGSCRSSSQVRISTRHRRPAAAAGERRRGRGGQYRFAD